MADDPRDILSHVAVVLSEPQAPENIGACARACLNMGVTRLIVVNPGDLDPGRMKKMATQKAEHLVGEMELFDTLPDALARFQFVVGATARKGTWRKTVHNIRHAAKEIVDHLPANEVALVFGNEASGLTNDDLGLCDLAVTIPTSDFSSLNLAQSVMVILYELFLAARGEPPKSPWPRLATNREMEEMFKDLRETLLIIDFLDPKNPVHWMTNIRYFLRRRGITAREVKIVRGICRQIRWFAGTGGKKG